MKLLIVSGLSGSGKSVALHTLEDLGYYCIDNLPAGLLGALASELDQATHPVDKVAVGIDARNLPNALQHFSKVQDGLQHSGIDSEILFLTCDDDILIKRFSETRRRHPLSSDEVTLAEAVQRERKLLEPIAARADLTIDTSQTNVHELRELISKRVRADDDAGLSLLFQSFGYKHGVPADADFVFDVRFLPNPHWQPTLRALTGRDAAVIDYLQGDTQVMRVLGELDGFLANWLPAFEADNRSYLTVAVGCTGGQHRSVFIIERLAESFRTRYPSVATFHRELS